MEWQQVVLQILKNQCVMLRALSDLPAVHPATKARILGDEAATAVLINQVTNNLRVMEVR